MRRATLAGLLLGLLAVACSEGSSWSGQGRIERVRVLEDRPRKVELGYGDVNMATNGEALMARTLIDPGDTVIDVGAYVGDWSRTVLEQHPDVHLHAFEPSPESFATLEKNLAGTGAIPVRMALSDRAGTMPFHVYPGAMLLDGFYDRRPDHPGAVTIEVPTVRLDAYCAERGITHVDYVKIDTEGAELLVLRGASGLFEKHAIRLAQFEYGGTYPDAGITLREVFELLSSSDYEIYRILRKGLLHVGAWRAPLENYRYANYLAVAP